MGKKYGKAALIAGALGASATAATAAYAVFMKRVNSKARHLRHDGSDGSDWHAIVVNKPRPEVIAGGPPAPLAALGNAIGYRVEATPDGGATKIAVHVREGETLQTPANQDADAVLQAALEQAKRMLEHRV